MTGFFQRYVLHNFGLKFLSLLMATGLWFLSTLGFGTYVSRFANYAQVYGSLGAGIALLFWLYLISLSVLVGAEFNAQLFPAYCGGIVEPEGD